MDDDSKMQKSLSDFFFPPNYSVVPIMQHSSDKEISVFSGLCTILKGISKNLEYELLFLNFFYFNLSCFLYFIGLVSMTKFVYASFINEIFPMISNSMSSRK